MKTHSSSVDYRLFFVVLVLIVFWMIMISSVSIYPSFKVTTSMQVKWLIEEAYNYFYVRKNIFHVLLSLWVLAVVVKTPYQLFEKYSRHIFAFVLVLLVSVLLIGDSWNGARWWINLPFLPFAIQPTEFLKFGTILFLAWFLKIQQKKIHTFKDGFVPFSCILWIILVLVGLQPDFWTIMVVIPLSVMMFFIAWANMRYLLILWILWVVLSTSVYLWGKHDKEVKWDENKLSYITDRIDNFLTDSKSAISRKTIHYQSEQALIAIGSGWFTGLWFGKSIQKYGYLPEVQWDFIFSVIAEELGFVWVLVLLSMFSYISYRAFYISYYSTDLFARYYAFGFACWIMLQACINIWVNLNIVPLTWITLPFVSYWWSSLLALSIGLWVLLNISKYIDISKTRTGRKKMQFRNKIFMK